jgi:hypothetical protein
VARPEQLPDSVRFLVVGEAHPHQVPGALVAQVGALVLRVQAPLLLEAQERQTLVAAVVAQAQSVIQTRIEQVVPEARVSLCSGTPIHLRQPQQPLVHRQ